MNLPKVSSRTVLWRIWGFDIQDASEMRYAAMVLHLCPLGVFVRSLG